MNIRKIKIAGIIMAAAGTAVLAGCAAGKDSGNSDGGVPVAQIVDNTSSTTQDEKNEAEQPITTATTTPQVTATTAPTATPALSTLEFVATDAVNVRASAGTDADVIDSLEIGDKTKVLEEVTGTDGNAWYHVNYNREGTTIDGYASKLYISQSHKLDSTAQVSGTTINNDISSTTAASTDAASADALADDTTYSQDIADEDFGY